MDAKDIKILALLQENASLSMGELSRRVHLSQTPCWRRIQKLEKEGVIEKRFAILNPAALGFSLSAFVEIHAPTHNEQWYKNFSEAVAAMPEIMEVHRMAGEVDYLLRVAVKSMDDYDQFYRRFVARVPTLKVTSRFSMERMKATTAYPINPAPPPGRL